MFVRHTKTPFFSIININNILTIICISGLIGFGIGFTKYFGNTYYLPIIPNIFDSIFIICSAIYLGYRVLRKEVKIK